MQLRVLVIIFLDLWLSIGPLAKAQPVPHFSFSHSIAPELRY